MAKQKRFILQEKDIPEQWYNIQADMVNKPMPPLNPKTREPLKAEDLYPIFAEEVCRQELDIENAWIDIPEEVREQYKFYRSTKKSSAYKAKITKKTGNYINTSGKKGVRYYYKARILVYDKNGKLVAQTELKQCKYACRVR